jgi:ribonuclease P protein subunit RPR2
MRENYLCPSTFETLEVDPVAKRRISNKEVRGIARRRITILMALARDAAIAGNTVRGRRYVELARRISMRSNVSMPKSELWCKECFMPLIPGRNCRVRLRDQRITTHCLGCNHIRRMPYIREKKEIERCPSAP